MTLTPLLWAIQNAQVEMVQLLVVNAGADIAFAEKSTGMTSLMFLCHMESAKECLAIAKIIFEKDFSHVLNK